MNDFDLYLKQFEKCRKKLDWILTDNPDPTEDEQRTVKYHLKMLSEDIQTLANLEVAPLRKTEEVTILEQVQGPQKGRNYTGRQPEPIGSIVKTVAGPCKIVARGQVDSIALNGTYLQFFKEEVGKIMPYPWNSKLAKEKSNDNLS